MAERSSAQPKPTILVRREWVHVTVQAVAAIPRYQAQQRMEQDRKIAILAATDQRESH